MTDDIVAPFALDTAQVRGRIVRLGAEALDPILRRHDYPPPVAMLLGETLGLASLIGSLLKAEGREDCHHYVSILRYTNRSSAAGARSRSLCR